MNRLPWMTISRSKLFKLQPVHQFMRCQVSTMTNASSTVIAGFKMRRIVAKRFRSGEVEEKTDLFVRKKRRRIQREESSRLGGKRF